MKINSGILMGLLMSLLIPCIALFTARVASVVPDYITAIIILLEIFLFIWVLIYFVVLKPNIEYRKIMKTGKPATGTILSMSETGTQINDQPLIKFELQVELPGVPAYTTTVKKVISYLQVSQFQPGAKVPIMVDAKNNMKVVFIKQSDMPQTNPLTNASPQQMEQLNAKLDEIQKENLRITAIGIYSKAIVTKYTDMGITVNGPDPLVTLEVMVMPDNEPAFSSTLIACLLPASIPKYQPGGEIFVKYDPNDKTKAVGVPRK